MTNMERTELGQEIETALGEVLAHVRGEEALPCPFNDLAKADAIEFLELPCRTPPTGRAYGGGSGR